MTHRPLGRPLDRPRARLLPAAFLAAALLAGPATAAPEGLVTAKTPHSYETLIERLNVAVKAHEMGLVTRASATVGAKAAFDKVIPGNMVIGVYHPRFAVPMLEASIAAGIEAPIRFYITENEDGTASLTYRKPTVIFAPYEGGGEQLKNLAKELDEVFASIAKQATAAE
ncbi:MAG: DUF302 domain-containing protein [Kiloniellales bacterium]|nr:DUF302 domain-containing protein [Kiloniellales bacterium]